MPGVVVIEAGLYGSRLEAEVRMGAWCRFLEETPAWRAFPLHVLVDDSEFASANLSNFIWTTFTRSDPAPDTSGAFARTTDKHWGCTDAFVIDARIKPHHAPPLEDDPDVVRRVERLGEKGRSLYGWV
jgi:4-hydroxy-3-polyprenylbenzoate decarboxylase